MDISNLIQGYPKIGLILDIHNSIYGFPKIGLYFRISIIHLMISLNHKKMMYVPKEIFLKMNYGCLKIDLWISLNQIIYGYPKIELWISKN